MQTFEKGFLRKMKLSYKQLLSYLPEQLSVEKTAEILTLTGLEVEDIFTYESVKGGLKGLVIGKVLEKEKHPDADRLSITKVDIGTGEILQIVCGAPNVDAGQTVVVATVGTTLYTPTGESFAIKKSKIRGVESMGMICAEDEIGLGKSHDGIMVLPNDIKIGTPASEYFNISSDTVIEINITPNRPDAACHIGAARDIVAFLGMQQDELRVLTPKVELQIPSNASPIQVDIQNQTDCIRYSGLHLRNVTVKESPEWLKNFLLAVGLRPINNVVDITNFVLMETGQPLHAFDAQKIKGNKVIVRNAKEGEKFTTLDSVERSLDSSNLLICDEEQGMCLAGVFGGLNSGISLETTEIFLESACFYPSSIRKTSKKHGLKTDSSFRFERGTDPEGTIYALKRAAALIQEYAGATIESTIIDIYPNPVEERVITLRKEKIESVLGMKIPYDVCRKILVGLGIEILEENEQIFNVKVPLFKVDVTREIDLIEELVRVYGLNNVPLDKHIAYTPGVKGERDTVNLYRNIAMHLAANGLNEILTNSLSYSKYAALQGTSPEAEWVKVLNPISSELDIMRPEFLFSGLEVVAHNKNHRIQNVRLFEIGRTYKWNKENKDSFIETEKLGIWVSGDEQDESWIHTQKSSDFYSIKRISDTLLAQLGIQTSIQNNVELPDYFAFGISIGIKNKTIGYIGKVSDKITQEMGIRSDVYYAEFNMETINECVAKKQIRYKEISKFPSVRRDLALVVDKKVTYKELSDLAIKHGKNLLKEVNLFDVYEGKNLPENSRSYAISYIFSSEEATLTDEIIETTMKKFISSYESELGAKLR